MMSYESEISVPLNAFGYNIEFVAEDDQGTDIPLNHLSGTSGFWFQVISGLDYVMWEDSTSGHFTINNASGGLFVWVVQSGFFNQIGIYEGKIWLRYSGGAVFPIDDLKISVVGRPW